MPEELNSPFSRWRHLTTTTRIHFMLAFLFKIVNLTESWEPKTTALLICTRKQQTKESGSCSKMMSRCNNNLFQSYSPFTQWRPLLTQPESFRIFLSCANWGFCYLTASLGLPNSNMKEKTKWILVLVVKRRHNANGLFTFFAYTIMHLFKCQNFA